MRKSTKQAEIELALGLRKVIRNERPDWTPEQVEAAVENVMEAARSDLLDADALFSEFLTEEEGA